MDSNLDFQPTYQNIYSQMKKEELYLVLSKMLDTEDIYMEYTNRITSIRTVLKVLKKLHSLTIQDIINECIIKNAILNILMVKDKIQNIMSNPENAEFAWDYWIDKNNEISDILFIVWLDDKWNVIKNTFPQFKKNLK